MSSFKITIPYTPKPKASVRLGRRGAYNPSSQGMALTRNYVIQNLPIDFPLMTGPLLVIAHFMIPVPLTVKGTKRKSQHMLNHAKRPDGDNLEKFLNDSLNGVLWTDDSQIACILRTKTYTKEREGSTVLFVRELPLFNADLAEIFNDLAVHFPHYMAA
jgi:Holliday junction resolvase RusA-like endonuclease